MVKGEKKENQKLACGRGGKVGSRGEGCWYRTVMQGMVTTCVG